jgi:uncharacterized protein YjiS (DUF1127 family)
MARTNEVLLGSQSQKVNTMKYHMPIRLILRIGETLARRRRARVATIRLSELDDRMLHDIGISRSQIDYEVHKR